MLYLSKNASTVFCATGLLGFGSGIFVPSIFAKVPERIEGRHIPVTMVMVNCGMFLGIFLSPYFSVLTKAIGTDSFSFDYISAIVLNILFAVVAYFLVKSEKK